jgi:predicted outer membrane lipoprotein
MNDGRLRSVYLVGIGISAYALWYFASLGAMLYATVFGVLTVFFVARLRVLTRDS